MKFGYGKATFIWEERAFPHQGAPAGAPSFFSRRFPRTHGRHLRTGLGTDRTPAPI
jgi:hypothetical protein